MKPPVPHAMPIDEYGVPAAVKRKTHVAFEKVKAAAAFTHTLEHAKVIKGSRPRQLALDDYGRAVGRVKRASKAINAAAAFVKSEPDPRVDPALPRQLTADDYGLPTRRTTQRRVEHPEPADRPANDKLRTLVEMKISDAVPTETLRTSLLEASDELLVAEQTIEAEASKNYK